VPLLSYINPIHYITLNLVKVTFNIILSFTQPVSLDCWSCWSIFVAHMACSLCLFILIQRDNTRNYVGKINHKSVLCRNWSAISMKMTGIVECHMLCVEAVRGGIDFVERQAFYWFLSCFPYLLFIRRRQTPLLLFLIL